MVKLSVDCAREIGSLDRFWQSTGFSPANLLLNADMRQAMTYAGSIPHGGITYVRVHYLLELVTVAGWGMERLEYDWTALDVALDVLVENGLRPFFELMGNPAGVSVDFLDGTQVRAWRRMVRDLAAHAIERYGREEVRGWYFETWNEPDIGFWTQGEEAFCNYYDACSEGLREVDERLRLGGPGTCRTLSSMFRAFLEHCDRGTNYFTRENGLRLDFVSVHEKGGRACPEDVDPDTRGIVERERRIIQYIRTHHPRLADVPFINDECDPQVGWWDTHAWRARPYYAALVARIIDQHLVDIVDGLGCAYALLSNDNGFLGQWGNRTLLARFGDVEEVDDGQAGHRLELLRLREDPGRDKFELVKKPVLNVMALLSLLGDRRCAAVWNEGAPSGLGAIATLRGTDQVAVLIYNSQDAISSSGMESVELRLEGLPFDRAMLAHYRIDEEHGNPFRIWQEMGSPAKPTAGQYAEIRRCQDLALLDEPREVAVQRGELGLDFDLPLPGVSLILLSVKPAEAPGSVGNVRAESYEGLTGRDEVMISWDGVDSRVIRTYEILYAEEADGPFERVNEGDLICTAFLHVRDGAVGRGTYRVRAVDYWGRGGEASPLTPVLSPGGEGAGGQDAILSYE